MRATIPFFLGGGGSHSTKAFESLMREGSINVMKNFKFKFLELSVFKSVLFLKVLFFEKCKNINKKNWWIISDLACVSFQEKSHLCIHDFTALYTVLYGQQIINILQIKGYE